MMSYRGARRHDFGEFSDKVFRMHAVLHIQQIGISVKVVEILQKREIESGFHSFIRLAHGKHCGELDGKLLVSYGGFQHGFVLRL